MADAADKPALPAPDERVGRGRRVLVFVLIVFATILLFVSVFAIWAQRLLLDTDEWVDTSAQLLESEEIRAVLGPYLADQVFTSLDLTTRFENALPDNLDALAAPLSGALARLASDNAADLLGRPRVQEAWRAANRVAHERFVLLVNDEGEFVRTTGGEVALDLKALVEAVAERTGVGERIGARIPEDAGHVVILRSDQLGAVQTLVRVLDFVGTWIWAICLVLFVVAGLLATGFRRKVLRRSAYGFLLVGILVLVALRIGGERLVTALIENPDVEPAGKAAWGITVASLRDTGRTVLGIGVIALVAAWLAGPGLRAVRIRQWLSPWMRERPGAVWGVFGVIVLLVLLWSPTRATTSLVSVLVLIAFAALGLEALRRMIVHEFSEEPVAPQRTAAPG